MRARREVPALNAQPCAPGSPMSSMADVATLLIRPERPDHPEVAAMLAALDRYLGELYEPKDNYIMDVEALLSSQVTFLVAEHERRLVGCGAVRRMPGEAASEGQPYGEIKRMMVLPHLRGQRIGERMLLELERTLRAQRIDRALLETGELQASAVRLYQRCGYQRRGSFAGYPDNGLSLFFEKRL
jgi:putative acetyltransferase